MEYIALFFISLLANSFSAFAGGGAGLLQLPALIFLGLPFSIALATHKVASVALGIGASIQHIQQGKLEPLFIVLILVSGLPGVFLGANIIYLVENRVAEILLGLLTLGLGIYSIFSKQLGLTCVPLHRHRLGYIIGAILLFIIGILNGSLTSGTGLFVTMWLVHWFGFDYKHAVATTLVLVGLFWNGLGAITLSLLSELQWDWLPMLLLGSLLGGYLGAHLSLKYSNGAIKKVFEYVTIMVGLSLILK